jgi:hypothetical protein
VYVLAVTVLLIRVKIYCCMYIPTGMSNIRIIKHFDYTRYAYIVSFHRDIQADANPMTLIRAHIEPNRKTVGSRAQSQGHQSARKEDQNGLICIPR